MVKLNLAPEPKTTRFLWPTVYYGYYIQPKYGIYIFLREPANTGSWYLDCCQYPLQFCQRSMTNYKITKIMQNWTILEYDILYHRIRISKKDFLLLERAQCSRPPCYSLLSNFHYKDLTFISNYNVKIYSNASVLHKLMCLLVLLANKALALNCWNGEEKYVSHDL